MYKACVPHSCSSAGVVAAIDAAVKDGVDILSLSIGGIQDPDFYKDPVSIALFGAVRAGVFVACSAGNFGPREYTLSNVGGGQTGQSLYATRPTAQK
jgi:hypothetical protein